MSKDKGINLGKLGYTSSQTKKMLKLGTPNGTFNGPLYEEFPKYDHPTGDSFVWRGLNNADIVIGRDRNAGMASGYGGKGYTKCGAIDLVAGRLSSVMDAHKALSAFTGPSSDPSRSSGIETGPNFAADAARVYITQRGDIDRYFALFLGNTNIPSTKNRSAVAIKADHARLIGRESVKIYAGKGAWNGGDKLFGEKHSRGGTIETSPVIELVAGNHEDIQPAVKGDNLHKVLKDIFSTLRNFQGAIHNIYTLLAKITGHLMGHQHPVVTALVGGIATIDPSLMVGSIETFIKSLCGQITQVFQQIDTVLNEIQYCGVGPSDDLSIPGWDDVRSSNVYIT